jgi:hypothetical protein
MSAVNHTTLQGVFNEAMQTLRPDGVKFDNVLLIVTDAAPYMKKAAEGLSVSYPKLIHVTCVAHVLHGVCETIRVLYPNANKLLANGKKIFVKSPARIKLFKNKAPDTPLPQIPVITRWRTWLDATVCYSENVEIFCCVVNEFHGDDASYITILQDIFQDSRRIEGTKK